MTKVMMLIVVKTQAIRLLRRNVFPAQAGIQVLLALFTVFPAQAGIQTLPTIQVNGLTTQVHTKDNTHITLRTRHARMHPKTRNAYCVDVSGSIHPEKKDVLQFRAPVALWNHAQKRIGVMHGISLASPQWKLTTDTALYALEDGVIKLPHAVHCRHPQGSLTSAYAACDAKRKRLFFGGGVKSRIALL